MTLGGAYGGGAVGLDLTKNNPLGVLYLKGNEFLDGSIRIILGDDGIATVEERAISVWNPGELELAQGSLLLDRDVKLSAAGHHLVVTAPEIEKKHVIVGQDFDDSGTNPPESASVGPKITRVVRQPDNSVELTLANHSSTISTTELLLCPTIYVQTGGTAASGDVQVLLTEGVPPNDIDFFRKNFPASKFIANTELVLDLSADVQFDPGVQINAIFTSPSAFTMRYDATGTFLWFAIDLQQMLHEDMLTETLILANDLRVCFANDLDLPRPNFVFV